MASTGAPERLRVVQAVDQVQVARAAGPGADRELPGQLGFRRGGEGGGLLVSYMDPVDPAVRGAAGSAYGIDDGLSESPTIP